MKKLIFIFFVAFSFAGQAQELFPVIQRNGIIEKLKINTSGTHLLSFGQKQYKVWEVASGRILISTAEETDPILKQVLKAYFSTDKTPSSMFPDMGTVFGYDKKIKNPFNGDYSIELKTLRNIHVKFGEDVLQNNVPINSFANKYTTFLTAFSEDNSKVFICADVPSIDMIGVETGTFDTFDFYEGQFKPLERVRPQSFDVSSNGKYLAASMDGTVKVWDVNTKELVMSNANSNERASNLVTQVKGYIDPKISFSTNRHYMGVSNNYGYIWDMQKGMFLQTLKREGNFNFELTDVAIDSKGILAASIGYHGRLKATGNQNGEGVDESKTLGIWEIESGSLLKVIPIAYEDQLRVGQFFFTSDDKNVVLCAGSGTTGNGAYLFDVEQGIENTSYKDNFGGTGKLIYYDPALKYVVLQEAGSSVGRLQLYNYAVFSVAGEMKGTFEGGISSDFYFFNDAKKFAITGIIGDVTLYDLNSIKKVFEHKGNHDGIDFNYKTGKLLLTPTLGNQCTVIDVVTNEVSTINAGSSYINDVKWVNDQRIAVALNNGFINLFDSKEKKQVATLTSDENEWCILTPENYYMSSPGAASIVHYSDGLQYYDFLALDAFYNRPDKVLAGINPKETNLIKAYNSAYLKRLKKLNIEPAAVFDLAALPSLVLSEDLPTITGQEQMALALKATSSKYPMTNIHVSINNIPVYGKAGIKIDTPTKYLEDKISVKLTGGSNKITIFVSDSKGNRSIPLTRVVNCTLPTEMPSLYIVAIGASEYANSAFNLEYAAKDATDIVAYFKEQQGVFAEVKDMVIKNEEATLERLKAAKEFLNQSSEKDVVMVFYAGHGLLDSEFNYFLAGHNVDFNNPQTGGIPYEDFEALFDGIPARQKLVMIDACHSGEVDKEEMNFVSASTQNVSSGKVKFRGFKNVEIANSGSENSFQLMKQLFAGVGQNTGAYVISSAGGSEFAFESPDWNNGVFTYALLDGLKTGQANTTGDNLVFVKELSPFVKNKVIELTQGQQHPTSREQNYEYDFGISGTNTDEEIYKIENTTWLWESGSWPKQLTFLPEGKVEWVDIFEKNRTSEVYQKGFWLQDGNEIYIEGDKGFFRIQASLSSATTCEGDFYGVLVSSAKFSITKQKGKVKIKNR